MEKSTITRRKIRQCLALAMGSAIIPSKSIAETIFINNYEMLDGESKKPIHIKSGNGKTGKIAGGDIIFKLNKTQTDGHLGLTEFTLPVGILGAPPHLHKGFDEICRVIEGTLTILVGDELFEVNAGD